MTNQHFQEFARRTMPRRELPEWMKEGAPPPPSWLDEPAEWLALKDQARAAWRLRPILEFAEAIVRGWRPHELASGQLDGGAQVGLLDGTVQRRASTTDPMLRRRAMAILEQLMRDRVQVDPSTAVNIESMAAGTWAARGGEVHLVAAEAAIAEAETAKHAAQSTDANRPAIDVPHAFRALGRTFAAGR